MLQSIHRFQDVHVHAAAIGAWKQTYAQISAGKLESSLMQLSTRRCHAFRERINKRVVQHGEAPKDQICFAFPITTPGAAHVQGREADDKSILFLQGGEEFMFHMPMDTDLLSLTFDSDLFEEHLHQMPDPDRIAALLKQPVIKVPPAGLRACRERLLNIFSRAMLQIDGGQWQYDAQADQREQALESSLLGELLGLLSAPDCDPSRQMSTTRSYIVEKLHRQTIVDAANVPSIFEVCQRLQVSRRTVQNSFQAVAETTPLNYLRCLRLNGVRRELLSTMAQQASIGDIASRWGFFHLSHFAEDYQALFGELPSQTSRRSMQKVFQ
ncbi:MULTISPECIES: helix-turn-helix domain-containing protein [unclassified Herbaspirillum]|uniref:helix-turn-helix domain-containing protein n=1 Tax=unclassified Herbaspirillum TaxID=2624150 RepID=UPI001151427E|nr:MULTISPECIES: helix-turn-helix domain-containing protein [unclassified Herbaspirillum]MBB5390180.1 AraC-like DNA-binding protein [Herbaspirillum sp. SJZ102]TQK09321.1 helix-turn-helix protein [Herbaspirillum sp. SJZ130]TQK13992.1 helix-turn-helix protein [Herbaspirillum sp. SJZ106]